MLADVSSYMKNIAILLVFIAFIGIILPNGKYKHYIDIVLGLILILVMLKPVAGWFSGEDVDYNALLTQFDAVQTFGQTPAQAYSTEIQGEMLDKSYKSMIKKQVTSLLAPYQFTIEKFDIKYVRETGEIQIMTLVLSETDSSRLGQPLITIEPVTIRGLKPKESEPANTETSQGIKKLKFAISDFYNLSVDNIYITVQKKN